MHGAGDGDDIFSFENASSGVDRIMDWDDGDQIRIAFETFGINVSSGPTIVNGTSASNLATDGVFCNTASGRVYTLTPTAAR